MRLVLQIAIGFAVLAILVTTTGALQLQQASTDGRQGAVGPHHMRELYTFASLGQMVAASDAVVLGTVTKSYAGRQVGDDDDTGGLSFTEIAVDVERVLHGTVALTITLEIDEVSMGKNDAWTVPGASVLLALTQIADSPAMYRPTNTQSVFVMKGDMVTPGLSNDEFTNTVAVVGRAALLVDVEDAAASVSDGTVTAPPTNQGRSDPE